MIKLFSKLDSSRIPAMVIIGVTTGAAVACVFVAAFFADEPGDILGFFGAALGAGAAVIGALWLEELKSSQQREKQKTALVQAMNQLALAAFNFDRAQPGETMGALLTLRQAVHTFDTVRKNMVLEDATAYFTMSSIVYWFEHLDLRAKELISLHESGVITDAQVRAAINPRLRMMPQAIERTFGAHPFWGSAKDDLETLLGLAKEQPLTPPE